MSLPEYDYLKKLRESGRQADLAGRIRDLRSNGWSISEIAEAIELTRQRIYVLLSKHEGAHSPEDAAPIEDRRVPPTVESSMKIDRARLPGALTDIMSALWRINLRDRSGGTSNRAKALDTMLAILLRRGVPNLAIAQEVGVTHRAVIARMARALERGTLPEDLNHSFLDAPKYKENRELLPRIPGKQAFALFQVVTTTYPRFYTFRDEQNHAYLFNPYNPNKSLTEHALDDFELITREDELVRAISDAMPDESPVYAAPVQWLYLESIPGYVWDKQNYLALHDFFPKSWDLVKDREVQLCFTNPAKVLRETPSIEWKAT